ncbi:MAG: hypothetical protein ACRDZO_02540 [Egibacteraceae bacterium]
MDLWTLLGIVLRQWKVVLCVLIAGAAMGGLALRKVAPVHLASAVWVLGPENQAAAVAAQGGRVGPDESELRLQANLIRGVVQGSEVRGRLAAPGSGVSYQVDLADDGPFLGVTAVAPDPGVAVGTAQAVIDVLSEEAATRTPGGSGIQVKILTAPETAAPVDPATGATGFAAGGTVVLEGKPPEPAPDDALGMNPLLLFSRETAVSLLAELSATPSFAARVRDAVGGEYVLSADQLAPLLRIRATGADEQAAAQTVDVVLGSLQERLAQLQRESGADPSTWFKLAVLSGTETLTEPGKRLQPALALTVLTALVGVSTALLVDGLQQRKRRSRPQPPDAPAPASAVNSQEPRSWV